MIEIYFVHTLVHTHFNALQLTRTGNFLSAQDWLRSLTKSTLATGFRTAKRLK